MVFGGFLSLFIKIVNNNIVTYGEVIRQAVLIVSANKEIIIEIQSLGKKKAG